MERYEVMVSGSAEADIQGIIDYLAKTLLEPDTARSMLLRFREAIVSLSSIPERFAIVSDSYLASLGIRVTSVGKYLIFYVVQKDAHRVDIVRVLYGKRNWTELLKQNREPME